MPGLTKREVDEWYANAVDGIGRIGAYSLETGKIEATKNCLAAVRSLAECKKDIYKAIGIAEEPTLISWREAVAKHREV